MKTSVLLAVEEQWPYLLTLLPANLEISAKASRALPRCWNVPNAASLIGLALAYAVSDLSLKDVTAWAATSGIAEITGPGLFYRLRESEGWLAELLAQTLQDQVKSAPKGLNLSVQQRWCEGRATLGGKTFLDKSSVEQPKV